VKNRLFSIILLAAMLLGIGSGCKKEQASSAGTEEQPQAATEQMKFAYKPTYEPIRFDPALQVQYINQFCMSGDSIYMMATCVTGKEIHRNEITGEPYLDENQQPIESDVTEMRLLRMELATRAVTQLNYRQTKPDEGKFGYTYVNSFAPGPDGTVWLAEQCSQYHYELPENFDPASGNAYDFYVDDGMTIVCRRFDSQGSELESVTLNTPDDVYINMVQFLPDGSIYGSDWMNIYLFDQQGQIQGSLELENGMNTFLPVSDTQIAVSLWEEDGNVLKILDPATMTLGEEIPIPNSAYSLRQGTGEYQFLYESNSSVMGIFDNGETEKLFSWIDCDVDNSNVNGFMLAPDGTVYAIENVWDPQTQRSTYSLIVMEQVDPATLPQKQVLTLACFGLPWDLRTEIINFNKSHEDVRITVSDYAEYATNEDYYAGIQKMNTEILSGLVPDIFYTDPNMPIASYAAKGILQDLWPLIDSDAELDRDDLMSHFFDVLSVDGKLYEIVDTFAIQTVIGRGDVIGQADSWTLDELMSVYQTLEPGATIFGEMDIKRDMLYSIIERSSNSFVDWAAMQCSFNSQEFIDLLTLVNSFPETFDYDNYDWDDYQSEGLRMRARQQMLLQTNVSSFDIIQSQYAMTDGTANYIGYPTTDGSGSSFEVYGGLAISSKCANTEAAWEFVRYYLTEEHQMTEYMWNFPTNKHAFDAYVEQCMTPNYNTNYFIYDYVVEAAAAAPPIEAPAEETSASEEPQEQPRGSYWFSDTEQVDYYALTEQELNLFMDLYEKTNSISSSNQAINDIIRQETEAFFAGQKTAEETARLIQDRASLYVFEQG